MMSSMNMLPHNLRVVLAWHSIVQAVWISLILLLYVMRVFIVLYFVHCRAVYYCKLVMKMFD